MRASRSEIHLKLKLFGTRGGRNRGSGGGDSNGVRFSLEDLFQPVVAREDFMALIAPSISEGLGLQLSKFSSESGVSHHSDCDAAGGVRCRAIATRPLLFKMRARPVKIKTVLDGRSALPHKGNGRLLASSEHDEELSEIIILTYGYGVTADDHYIIMTIVWPRE